MISDEIREFVQRSYADEHMDPRELLALADRIDAEMICRPRAADGDFVYEGDMVRLDDSEEDELYVVKDVRTAVYVTNNFWSERFEPEDLVHTKPDTFEHIADELDNIKLGRSLEDLRSIANRIRKLARGCGDGCR